MRLPERRDYIGEEEDPVTEYYKKRDENKKFFRMRSQEKVDLTQFGKTNYMTSPNTVVGVSKHKNYLTDKKVTDLIDKPDSKENTRYVFDETMRKGAAKSTRKPEQDKLDRELTVEKFKIMKKIISNEKKVSKLSIYISLIFNHYLQKLLVLTFL